MIEWIQRRVAWLMYRVRVNQIQCTRQYGQLKYLKRRRIGGSIAIWYGNRFLALARSGIQMFVRADEWAEWEVHCVRLLYPERPCVEIGSGQTVMIPEVPGISLRRLLQSNEPSVSAFVAAARELRRVHQIPCSYYQSQWSHGDLHLDNILYDSEADCAFLIDFDTRHESQISPTQCHSDDLKVMLLELLALPNEKWQQPASALIEEYRDPAVLGELFRQLDVPRGFARLLWFTRTNCIPTRQIEPRLLVLREIIRRIMRSSKDTIDAQLCHDPS